MILQPVLRAQQRQAQWRTALDVVAVGLPVVAIAAATGWRLSGALAAAIAGILSFLVLAGVAVRRARRLDRVWLVAQLDARLPRFEDSTALLFRNPATVGGLAALQRRKLEARIGEARQIDLRAPWSLHPIAIGWVVGAAATAATLLWPVGSTREVATPAAGAEAGAVAPAITQLRLRITPPAYTGLPVREQTTPDARVPEGSRVEWIIGFAPRPPSAQLAFVDAAPTGLVRDGEVWTGGRVIAQPSLYRIEADGLAAQPLRRIDTIADAPPAVRLIEPDRQLLLVTPGQTRWTPVFEATDDYGVSSAAVLRITVTEGDGENITVRQRTMALSGVGEARRRRFSVTLDLAREGLAPGGDLIVQLVVSDNRTPEAQTVEGPSVILRWPSDLAMAEGLDGMAVDVLPVYFRSQRQIIIDAEALIAERARLQPRPFMDRSNGLGADQAQLRLRYGQFMGEEAEGGGGGGLALPTNDAPAAPALPTNDDPAPAAGGAAHDDHADDHDHGDEAAAGGEVDVLSEFGHAHDTGDAATLFDPPTRSTLAQALDAMWASERELRQGRPDAALPHAYRALELLKLAQQATRIFLARTGPDLPPIDLSRRLTGDREDIVAALGEAPPPASGDTPAVEAWRALEDRPGPGRAPPLALGALERWARDNRGRLADPLALSVTIDAVRRTPNCMGCRRTLRALLWSALDRPPAAVQRRAAPDRRGGRYLDALR